MRTGWHSDWLAFEVFCVPSILSDSLAGHSMWLLPVLHKVQGPVCGSEVVLFYVHCDMSREQAPREVG